MTTMTIVPKNNAMLPFLEQLLSNPAWVKKVVINEKREERPNAITQQAIEEAREGKGVKCKNIDDFFKRLKA